MVETVMNTALWISVSSDGNHGRRAYMFLVGAAHQYLCCVKLLSCGGEKLRKLMEVAPGLLRGKRARTGAAKWYNGRKFHNELIKVRGADFLV